MMKDASKGDKDAGGGFAPAPGAAGNPRPGGARSGGDDPRSGGDDARSGGDDDARWRFFDALTRYQRALQDAWTDEARRRSGDPELVFSAQQEQPFSPQAQAPFGLDEARDRSEQAREEYVRTLQDTWSSLDPARTDPWTLAAIAQSIAAAAWLAAAQAAQTNVSGVGAGGWGGQQNAWGGWR